MAESEFSIEIGVTADLTQFRAQLRAELEQASKGVVIPVRGRDPGGQGAPSFPTVAAAEQAAVQRAMDQAQARTPGYYGRALPSAMAGAAGAAVAPRVQTGEAEGGFRRLRSEYDSLRQHIERNPLRIQVDSAAAQSALARAGVGVAGVASGPSASAAAAVAQQLGLTGAAAQAFVQSATPPQAAVQQALQQAAGVIAPTRAPAPAGAGGSRNAWGRQRAGDNILPTNSIRGLFGLLSVTELGSAMQAIRGGEQAAFFARTSEESFLARAQANEQATSGLIGGTISFLPNLLNLRDSPQRQLREAQEAVELRRIRDDARQQQFSTAADVAYRRGYATGGPNRAQIERLKVESASRHRALDEQRVGTIRQINEPLEEELSFGAKIGLPGAIEADASEIFAKAQRRRSDLMDSLSKTEAAIYNERDEAGFRISQLERQRNLEMTAMRRRIPSLRAAAEGRPRLAAERAFGAGLLDQLDAVDDDPEKFTAQKSATLLQLQARQEEIATQRFETRQSLDAQIRQSRFRQVGGRYAVESITDPIVTATNREAREFDKDEERELAVKRRTLGVQQIRQARADYFRSIRFEEVSGGRIAAGSGSPFAGVERKFSDAEDQIGKAGGKASVGAELDSEKVPGLLNRLLTVMEQVRDRHFKAKAG